MSDRPFDHPRRQEPIGVIILFGENVRKLIRVVAALVFASIYVDELPLSTSMIIGIGVVIMAIYTLLQYLRFKFHIEGDELILQKGVFKRERLSIPLERIQSVHTSQNILQQILQLSGVKIDTAGSGQEELRISALTQHDARELQTLLEMNSGPILDQSEAELEQLPRSRRVLVKLNIPKLLVVGLTENHIRSGLIALGVVWGYYWQFEDYLRDQLWERAGVDPNELGEALTLADMGIQVALYLVIIFLMSSVVISLIRVVLKHFDLEASVSDQNIRVSSGLLKRNVYTIPLNKIQMMTWKGNFLRRIPGFESVIISQSRSETADEKNKVEIPACYNEQTARLERALFDEVRQKESFKYAPHPYYRILLSLVFLVIGMLMFGLLYIVTGSWIVLLGYLVYALGAIPWIGKYTGSITLKTNGDLIEFSSGWLFSKRTMVKSYKIQSIRFKQSIFQMRRGTAHLKLYTAGGSLNMLFMPEELVKELYDFLLYKVEVSERSWM